MSDFATAYGMKKRAGKMCNGGAMAEGGEVPKDEAHHEDADMIARIMHKRNQYKAEDAPEGDAEPEADYTGADSGDEMGDAAEDKDRSDIIAKIMKSRSKKA